MRCFVLDKSRTIGSGMTQIYTKNELNDSRQLDYQLEHIHDTKETNPPR
jgi:hypothetical protein